jgi:VWA domain-containing protein
MFSSASSHRSTQLAPAAGLLLSLLLPLFRIHVRSDGIPSRAHAGQIHGDVTDMSGSAPSLNLSGTDWSAFDINQGIPTKHGIIVVYTPDDPLDAQNAFPIQATGATVTLWPDRAAAPLAPCTRVPDPPGPPLLSNANARTCVYTVGFDRVTIYYYGQLQVGVSVRYTIAGLTPAIAGPTFVTFDSDAPKISGAQPPAPKPTTGRISARLVLVLDKSGSMAWSSHPLDPGCGGYDDPPAPGCGPSRWAVLKNAVNAMLTVASAYNIASDQVAVAAFSDVVPPQNTIGLTFLAANAISNTRTLVNTTLQPGGATSIGQGLKTHESQIQPVAPGTRTQLVLLFTDGDQNTAPFVVFNGNHMLLNPVSNDLLGTTTEYAAAPGTPPANTDTAMVCPFALRADAPNAPLGTVFIDGIATRRCKGVGNTALSVNPEEPALMQWFLQVLNKALLGDKLEVASVQSGTIVAPVPLPPAPFPGASDTKTFTISAMDRAFTVLLTTGGKNRVAGSVTLTKDGETFDLTNSPGIQVEQGPGYLSATLRAPFITAGGKKVNGKGTWTLHIGPVFRDSLRYNLFVNVDNRTIASDFTAIQPTPGVGHPILLTARLVEGGSPITGLPSGSVKAILGGPGSGLGNVLSAAQIAPIALGPADTLNAAARKAKAMLGSAQLRPAILAALLPVSAPSITLQEVSPGTYQANYANTNAEGIYPITFVADFQTPDNGRVTRIFSLTRYVPITVDQPATQSTAITTAISPCPYAGGCFSITLKLKDNHGNLAGPGKTPLLFIPAGQGVLLGPIVDNLNGSYTLRVGSNRPVGAPIGISYGDTPINILPQPSGGGGGIVVVLPYAGVTHFTNALGLKDGLVVGVVFGHHLTDRVTAEAEGGVTFTKAGTQSGRVVQLLGNLRWVVMTPSGGGVVPHVTAGAGYALFRGFGTNDQAFLYQAGVGATFKVGNRLGLRIDARTLRIAAVSGAGATTNYQGTLGLVWRF